MKDPRQKGKALTGNLKGVWRYRVGNYGLFAKFENEELIIIKTPQNKKKKY